jgi:hypothetical protein
MHYSIQINGKQQRLEADPDMPLRSLPIDPKLLS